VHASDTIQFTGTLRANFSGTDIAKNLYYYYYYYYYSTTTRRHCPATTALERAAAQVPHLGPQDGVQELVRCRRRPAAHEPPQ
jgi:hypothetical protein